MIKNSTFFLFCWLILHLWKLSFYHGTQKMAPISRIYPSVIEMYTQLHIISTFQSLYFPFVVFL
ncbi:hypothetical protein GLYMA_19G174501v4 [Glycine max]|nr:hypothetical protein GLYMA_19G174501v4 [Glycine max]KAH1078330.1 hypothetical protein GYH30_053366 [Glycine max]